MEQDSNADVLKKTYHALIEGDRETLEQLVTPDAQIHVPGRNIVAGEYQGVDAMIYLFKRLVSLTEATYHRELLDILAGETHAAALVHVTGRHGARLLDLTLMFLMTISDGRVTDIRSLYADQNAWDAFWSDQMLTGSSPHEFQPPKRPIDP